MRRQASTVGAVVVSMTLLSACGPDTIMPVRENKGTMVITLVGGVPGASAPPGVVLKISGNKESTTVTAIPGQPLRVPLPPGSFLVQSPDGKACGKHINVDEDATVQANLLYPSVPGQCEDFSGPPAPPGPGTPPPALSISPPSTTPQS